MTPVIMLVMLLHWLKGTMGKTTFQILMQPKSFDEASRICSTQNGSVVDLSDHTQAQLIDLLRTRRHGEFRFWTQHKKTTNFDLEYRNSEFESLYDGEYSDGYDFGYTNNMYCVYGNYTPVHNFINWATDDCENKYVTICKTYTARKDSPYNVTFYKQEVTRDEADAICKSEGAELVGVEDELKHSALEYFFKKKPWKENSGSTFWTSIRTNGRIVGATTYNDISNEADDVNNNVGLNCVVGNFKDILIWSTTKCNAGEHAFMCQIPLESCYFMELPETKSSGDIIKTERGNVRFCERICDIMGSRCSGFNYDPLEKNCEFTNALKLATVMPSYEKNFHARMCSIRPLVANYSKNNQGKVDTSISDSIYKENVATSNTYASENGSTRYEYDVGHTENITITEPACQCSCSITNKTLEEKITELVNAIKVDKKTTSSYHRRLNSAPDSRTSSKGMGMTAGAILGSIAVGIIAMDSHRITANMHALWKVARKFFRY